MNNHILVVAPHPDDETLGCGATILKYKKQGHKLFWLIITDQREEFGFSKERELARAEEVRRVEAAYEFKQTWHLGLAPSQLDAIPKSDVISGMVSVFNEVKPHTIFVPFKNDIHSDHTITFECAMACSKWFRRPELKEILVYETVSETDIATAINLPTFTPNLYENVTQTFEEKMAIMDIYQSEMAEFPFPRSRQAIEALAMKRGAECGYLRAEAFMILKQFRD
jgi:LmbE family N-acetylglucosaminyl deacetylase